MSDQIDDLVKWILSAIALLKEPYSVDDNTRLTAIISAEASLDELATIARDATIDSDALAPLVEDDDDE